VDTDTVEKILCEAPAVMKQGLSLADARHYADSIQGAGGRVRIEEYGVFEPANENGVQNMGIKSMRDFTMCPECGHKQVKSALCVKCGFLFNRKG
jgi:ribosomal protein L37E